MTNSTDDVNGPRREEDGWLKISRGLYDHPIVGFNHDGEPYCRTLAWLDLLRLAVFKESYVFSYMGRTYNLCRGELVTSQLELAKRWGWSRKKVRTFVTILRANQMLKWVHVKGQPISIVTILNYNDYQVLANTETANSGANPVAKRGHVWKKECSLKKEKKDSSEANASAVGHRQAVTAPKQSRVKKSSSQPGVETPDEPLLPWVREFDDLHAVGKPIQGEPVLPDRPQEALGSSVAAIDEGFGVWDRVALDFGLRACKSRSERRRRLMAQRLKAIGGAAAFETTLRTEIARSPFLLGKVRPREGRKQFRLDLDFILQASSWDRIVDGRYADDQGAGALAGAAPVMPPDVWNRQLDAYRASLAEAERDNRQDVLDIPTKDRRV